VFFNILAALALGARAEMISISSSPVLPTYVALSANINDFSRFADGGPDANWYIGFNNAWLVKLPPAPMGDFTRAFIGAKIGRAKTRPAANKPWLREIIAGKVYIGVSPRASFTSEQSYFLAETSDIPLEADPQAQVEGAGASVWFWAEVPLNAINFSGPNYLAVWSPTNYFTKASSAPILAAGSIDDPQRAKETSAWNNRSISGVPPRIAATSLETPINNINPALAIKLVPQATDEVGVTELTVRQAGRKSVVEFSVGGENIVDAWVESSKDQLDWERISPFRRQPPFSFSFTPEKYPAPGEFIRGAARDNAGNVGRSLAYTVPFPPTGVVFPQR
jgi:hypothetical protein